MLIHCNIKVFFHEVFTISSCHFQGRYAMIFTIRKSLLFGLNRAETRK